MNKLSTKILCVLFAVLLMFTACFNIQPKAEAVAVTATSTTITVIMMILTALGITFATQFEMQRAAMELYQDPSVRDFFATAGFSIVASGNDLMLSTLPTASSNGLSGFVSKILEKFGKNSAAQQTGSFPVASKDLGVFYDVAFIKDMTGVAASTAYASAIPVHEVLEGVSFDVNSVNYSYFPVVIDGGESQYIMLEYSKNGVRNNFLRYIYNNNRPGWAAMTINIPYQATLLGYAIGFGQAISSTNVAYLVPYLTCHYVDKDGFIQYAMQYYAPPDLLYQGFSQCVPISGDGIADYKENVSITSEVEFDELQWKIEMTKKLEELIAAVGAISIPIATTANPEYWEDDGTLEDDEELVPYIPLEWWILLEKLGIKDKIKAEEKEITKPVEEIKPDDYTMPDLRNKFPFCVPFDLIALVGVLNAPAIDPVWTIPFKIDSINYQYDFVFDLTEFETLAQVIRWFSLAGFILSLTLITRKLIKG